MPFVVGGAVLSFPAENKREAGFDAGSILYFSFSSAMESIAPVCLTAEPELSVDALDSVLAARAAGRCVGVSADPEGLRTAAEGFWAGVAFLRCSCCFRAKVPTDSSDSPSLDA